MKIINEKSKSQNQQQLMGMALSYKRGTLDTSKLNPDLLKKLQKMAEMSEKDLKDFAGTKHKGLPELKETLTFKKFMDLNS